MIVSTPIAVLPVWRSPMISSRWPRPIGIIESIAFRPVWSGSTTGWRWTTPGALNSAGRFSVVSIGPLPSSGLPSGSTMRPSRASPTGTSRSLPVRLTVSPSTILSQLPKSTTPTLSASRLSARPVTSCGSSSVSKLMQFSRPCTRAMPSPTERTVPTSVSSDDSASSPSMRRLRMDVISSGLICSAMGSSGRALTARDLLAKLFESVADGRVHDRVTHPQDDAADDVRIHVGRELDLAPGLLGDAVAERAHELVVELHRRGDLHRQQLVLLAPERVVRAADPVDDGHPVLLEQELEEVHDVLVGAVDGLVQAVDLLLRGEVGREEERRQVAVAFDRVGDLAELLAHDVDRVVLLGDLEVRASVDLGEVLHLGALPSGEGLEVELAQRVLDETPLVGLVER